MGNEALSPADAPGLGRREVATSCDLDQARAVGGDLYYPHDVKVMGERRFRMDIDAARIGPVTIGWISYATEVRVRTGVLRSAYQINVPSYGELRSASGSERVVASPRCAAVYRPDRTASFEGWTQPCEMLAIKIEREALEAELAAMLGRPVDGPLQLGAALDLTGGRGRQWWGLVQALAVQLRADDALAAHPLLGAPLVRGVVGGLLLSADHQYRAEIDALDGPARPAAIRRAVEFIEERATDAITVSDIAAAAGTGVRSLQQGFQAAVGVSPLTFLRNVRLAGARADLLRADPEGIGVAEIAYRWGFSHLGRFAGHYRDRYHEAPSQTLRTLS